MPGRDTEAAAASHARRKQRCGDRREGEECGPSVSSRSQRRAAEEAEEQAEEEQAEMWSKGTNIADHISWEEDDVWKRTMCGNWEVSKGMKRDLGAMENYGVDGWQTACAGPD